jgi:cytochrome oxidase Cu insertion factor (SCO1/SenC/PrrC family)
MTRRSMGRSLAGAAALVLAARAALAAPDFPGAGFQPYDPPKPAPPLALPDLAGRARTLEEFRGRVLVLFFWATW